jgi:predicted NAD/FAD-dependent oxidoreductase
VATIGIIGAGMAGAAAAAVLKQGGASPIVLDKGRSVGGRLATRLTRFGMFDHGAQFIRKDEPGWNHFLSSLKSELVPVKGHGGDEATFAPVGPFPTLVAPLLHGVTVHSGATVRSITRSGRTWTLETADGQKIADLAAVLVTSPAPQAVALAGAHSREMQAAARVRFEAVWCVMLAFEVPVHPGADWLAPEGEIALATRVNARPGRSGGYDRWVVHASPAWSADNLELDKAVAAAALVERFRRLGRIAAEPVYAEGHRWRYAQAAEPLGRPYLLDRATALAVAGDWCLGRTAGDAFQSGSAAGRALLELLG